MKVKVLFTSSSDVIGTTVKVFTHGKWSHVGIIMLDGLVEAIQPKVQCTENYVEKYKDHPQKLLMVDIPNIDCATAKAKELLGTPYGLFTDCVVGGIKDEFGLVFSGNGEGTVNCSETVTRILRASGLDILSGVPADCITPNQLYLALLEIIYEQNINLIEN